jgi:hypothetical protein
LTYRPGLNPLQRLRSRRPVKKMMGGVIGVLLIRVKKERVIKVMMIKKR